MMGRITGGELEELAVGEELEVGVELPWELVKSYFGNFFNHGVAGAGASTPSSARFSMPQYNLIRHTPAKP